jgi:hypothetical protein
VNLEDLLTEQLITQREFYGVEPGGIPYIRLNALALDHEVHEALDETDWKTWSTNLCEKGGVHTDRYLSELVVALNFLLNLLLASGLPPAVLAREVERLFYLKKKLNLERHGRSHDL